jgi:hypothetical protein
LLDRRPTPSSSASSKVSFGKSIIPRRDVYAIGVTGGGGTLSVVLPLLLGLPESAAADAPTTEQSSSSSDLTTQLFNTDGSLKQEMDAQAKFRQICVQLDNDSTTPTIVVDGKQQSSTSSSSFGSSSPPAQVKVTYQIPESWSSSPPPYVNTNTQQEVCQKITILRVPNPDPATTLKKATQIGVAKALRLPSLYQAADLVGGRTSVRKTNNNNDNDQKLYYEFDLAVAPTNCDTKNANQPNDTLGLGLFCPYESIALVSATASSTDAFVLLVESNPDQWKRANADLRRIRTSFTVLLDDDDDDKAGS